MIEVIDVKHVILLTLLLFVSSIDQTLGHLDANAASQPKRVVATQEIHYHDPEASEVFLVWGINGWRLAPEPMRPPGTIEKQKVLHTPMVRQGEIFSARIQAESGTMLDYAFLITKNQTGAVVEVVDTDGRLSRNYHILVTQDNVIEVVADRLVRFQIAPETEPVWGPLALLMLAFGLVYGTMLMRRHFSESALRYQKHLSTPTTKLIAFVIVTRLLLLLIGHVSINAFVNPNEEYVALRLLNDSQPLITAFSYADVSWYMDIAQHGYEHRPFTADRAVNWGFFPLWPIILSGCNILCGEMVISGLVASNLLLVLGVISLYRLFTLDFDEHIAVMSIIFLITFPSAYFFSRSGPESLFLFLVVTSFLYARKNHWITASLLGALATLARPQGILLLLPLLVLYYKQYRLTKALQWQGFALLLLPTALLSFMLYMYWITGNPFANFAIQGIHGWDNSLSYPFAGMARFLTTPYLIAFFGWDLSPVSFLFGFMAVVLSLYLLRAPQIPKEYAVYTVASVYLIISRNSLSGSLRYMLLVFPLFLGLGLWTQDKKTGSYLILFAFSALQAFYFIAFALRYNWAVS